MLRWSVRITHLTAVLCWISCTSSQLAHAQESGAAPVDRSTREPTSAGTEQDLRLDALEQRIGALAESIQHNESDLLDARQDLGDMRLDALEQRIGVIAESIQRDESDLLSAQQELAELPSELGVGQQQFNAGIQDEIAGFSVSGDDYRGGTLRLGVFQIDNIKARLYFGPDNLPLGGRIDLEEDLGFGDRVTAFRASLAYRFSERHGINVGYYKLGLDGIRRLSKTVELGGRDFDIGIDVVSEYEETIFKLAYNYIFHDDGKVLLSVTPGIHFSDVSFRIGTRNTPFDVTEAASTTAPLPMFGGRLVYRITPKLSMFVMSDIFFLSRSNQEGSLTDSHIVFEHRTFDRVGFGAGINRFSLNLDLAANGILWDWESVYTGAYLFVTVQF